MDTSWRSFFIARRQSMPFIRGIFRSSKMQSGLMSKSLCRICRASLPFFATMHDMAGSTAVIASRKSNWSSSSSSARKKTVCFVISANNWLSHSRASEPKIIHEVNPCKFFVACFGVCCQRARAYFR